MPTGAFDDAVRRHLRGRSITTVEQEAGLPESSLKNMRKRAGMPSPTQIATVAGALGASPATLTRALLLDRGYDLGAWPADASTAELGAIAQSLPPRERELLIRLAEVVREAARRR